MAAGIGCLAESTKVKELHMSPEELLSVLNQRFERIEAMLANLKSQQPAKSCYTPAEFAAIAGKAEFTVREWCRLRRIHAEKRACGRGDSKEWMISHEELQRYLNNGLLPRPTRY